MNTPIPAYIPSPRSRPPLLPRALRRQLCRAAKSPFVAIPYYRGIRDPRWRQEL